MVQCLVPLHRLFLAGLLLISILCASDVIAKSNHEIEREANIRSEKILPTGWINSISSESTVIDDSYYIFTDKTRFLSPKSKLKAGDFVEFKLSKENFVDTIGIVEPQEKDMYMKPIVHSESPLQSDNVAEPQKHEPQMINGIWVN